MTWFQCFQQACYLAISGLQLCPDFRGQRLSTKQLEVANEWFLSKDIKFLNIAIEQSGHSHHRFSKLVLCISRVQHSRTDPIDTDLQ